MVALPDDYISSADYLVAERQAPTKHEYINGRVYAMSGATRSHNRISLDTAIALSNQLGDSDCEAFVNDMRVKVPATELYTYPDVIVACGPKLEDDSFDTLLNPTVIIEVLSPSTERFDRGDKFGHYQRLDSLQDYVLVAQDRPRVEHYSRRENQQWLLTVVDDMNKNVMLDSVHCILALKDIYRRVQFEPTAAPAGG